MDNIKSQFKGNLGMFLVCAELSKYNLIAMPTARNTKGYDIVVLNPNTGKASPIQVKCTDKKDFPILSSYWRDYEDKTDESILCDFVFVDISNLNEPRYFIVTEKTLKDVMKSSIREWADRRQQRHNLDFEEMLELERAEKRKPNLWALKLSKIEAYENDWDNITNKLK